MKYKIGRPAAIVLFLLLGIGAASAQMGGGYDLSWSTVDGGGGLSSGGSYEVTGTAGQPDAGYAAGGSYEILNGFWQSASGNPTAITLQDYQVRPKSDMAAVLSLQILVLAGASLWFARRRKMKGGLQK
jgi:hypothetical protein